MAVTPTLIVDDSLMITKIIKKALLLNTLDGYKFDEEHIYTAADGMEAFEKMGANRDIQLIITDINMPNLNGQEFIEILKDTGKLDKLTVIFVTSSSTKLMLPSSIRDDVLGVIYKPFRYDGFNQQIELLKQQRDKDKEEFKRIKLAQFEQKKDVFTVCKKYLEDFKIPENLKILRELINENFGDEDVGKDEYPDMAYAILSTYMFDIGCEHNINNKKILCIIKSFKKKEIVNKNRFGLISGFEMQVEHVNANNMKLRKVLEELTVPLVDKISLALAKANKYPRLKPQLYAPYVDYIMEELEHIDCYFEDIELEKTILEQKEVLEFNQWLLNLLQKHELEKKVDAVAESKELKLEIERRLKVLYKRSVALAQHFSGQIEYTIWKKAKRSLEIKHYLKNRMPKTMPTSPRFLLHKGKLNVREFDEYLAGERENVIVVSNDLSKLEKFKMMDDEPFNHWSFFCYAKDSLFHSWMKNKMPTKIIIDYEFKTLVINNGIQFLKQIIKKYPQLQSLVRFEQIYMISSDKNMIEVHKNADQFNVCIMRDPLEEKELKDTLLYH